MKHRQGVAPNLPRQVNVNPCPRVTFYSVERVRRGGGRRTPPIRPMMEFELREKQRATLNERKPKVSNCLRSTGDLKGQTTPSQRAACDDIFGTL